MWPFQKAKPRRREVHRQRVAGRTSLLRRLLSGEVLLPLAVTAGFLAAATGIILYGDEPLPYRLGEVVRQAIPVRVGFDYEDQAETHRAREDTQRSAAAVYVLNQALLQRVEQQLDELLTVAKSESEPAKALAQKGWTLDAAALKALAAFTDDNGAKQFGVLQRNALAVLTQQNLVARIERGTSRLYATLRRTADRSGNAHWARTMDLDYVSNEEDVRQAALATAAVFPEALRIAVASRVTSVMRPGGDEPDQPVYQYNNEITQSEADAAAEGLPPTIRTFAELMTLVPMGTELKPEHLDLLREERAAYRAHVEQDPALHAEQRLAEAGMAVLVLLVTIGLATFTRIDQPRIVRNPIRALTAAALLLVVLIAARLIVLADWPRELIVAGIVIAASVFTMAYTRRFAIGACIGASILATLAMVGAAEGGSGLLILLMVASGITVVTLREVRTRTKLIEVGALAGVAAFLAAGGDALVGRQTHEFAVRHAAVAGGAGLAAGFFLQGMLPLIERGFHITTSLKLLEWCDANRPLLKRMAQEAPGTYNHSLVVSSLAEAAAEAVGLNGLLLRVGALYHDIGKMNKPDYFAENQQASINRHDSLSPTISHLIIVGHVKDGVEMAKEYGLPSVLVPYIAEHHGTTVVRYFHQVASEQRERTPKGKHDREVADTEFRYPGPKPQSKGTAIMMLCDSVEGAARAMPEPTAGRIEALVHQMVMERLRDGQLDHCDITLHELALVEESLVKSLCRFYHSRIAYPQRSGSEAARRGTA